MWYISIINYDRPSTTANCIKSIVSYSRSRDMRILLHDNSEVSQLEKIQSKLSEKEKKYLDYYFDGKNEGFGRTHNKVFNYIKHRIVSNDIYIILNNDTLIENGNLFTEIENNITQRTIYTCMIRERSSKKMWYCGGKLSRFTGDLGIYKEPVDVTPYETDFVSGCLMAMQAQTFDEIGGFDKRFFMYAEDLQLSIKSKMRGIRLIVLPAEILHEVGSGTRGTYTDLYLYENTKNRLIVLEEEKLGIPLVREIYFILKYLVARALQLAFLSNAPIRQIKEVKRGVIDGIKEINKYRSLDNDYE